MLSHSIQTRVRYSETDKMGFCYYGNYAQFFEMGRVETLREIGVSYASMEDQGILLPVVDFSVKYFKPAFYDELLTIKTTLVKEPLVKIEFDYEIFNEKNERLTKANTVLVFTDAAERKPIKAPDELIRKIREKLAV
ncbi:MAG: acyl-CoA thioesterase [Flavobacteriales bacterium]|nr:acyl-CoA thioesterase [Flavobacteriales bacterium]